MTDREISAGNMVAWAAWGAAVSLLAVMWVTNDWRYGQTGLVAAGIAITATIRTYFVNLGSTTRNAFEIGQDSVRRLPRG
jgi:hypothetical protein